VCVVSESDFLAEIVAVPNYSVQATDQIARQTFPTPPRTYYLRGALGVTVAGWTNPHLCWWRWAVMAQKQCRPPFRKRSLTRPTDCAPLAGGLVTRASLVTGSQRVTETQPVTQL